MKAKLFYVWMVGFALCILSCNSNSNEVEKKDSSTTGTLYVMGTRSVVLLNGEIPPEEKPYPGEPGFPNGEPERPPYVDVPPMELIFTGDDIELFNVNTGEIVFTKVKADDIRYSLGLYTYLYFYLNDEPLFDPPLRIHSEVSSILDVLGLSISGSKICFHRHTQNYDFMPAARREEAEKEQDELVQKRKKEMDTFIKYLTDAGKIVK